RRATPSSWESAEAQSGSRFSVTGRQLLSPLLSEALHLLLEPRPLFGEALHLLLEPWHLADGGVEVDPGIVVLVTEDDVVLEHQIDRLAVVVVVDDEPPLLGHPREPVEGALGHGTAVLVGGQREQPLEDRLVQRG